MLSRIVQLTEEAQLSKPKLQRWLDKFGEQYSKAVVLLSLAVAFLGPFLFKWPFISTAGTFRSLNLSRYFFVCIYVLLSTSVFLALLHRPFYQEEGILNAYVFEVLNGLKQRY